MPNNAALRARAVINGAGRTKVIVWESGLMTAASMDRVARPCKTTLTSWRSCGRFRNERLMWRNFDREVGVEAAEYALMDTAEHRLWWYRALHARILDALAGVAGPVLDAGCGTGGLLVRLAQNRALAPIGVEFSPGAAMRAAAKSGVPMDILRLPSRPMCCATRR
jgi:SAM-dependent methyltransferase